MKILMLGTGNAQLDAVNYLKQKGHTVHAVSYRDEGPGREAADHFTVIDIVDKEAVLACAVDIKAGLVTSVGSDVALPTIAYVSEKLSLPCFTDEKTASLMHHKGKFRSFLKQRNVAPVDFILCRTLDQAKQWSHFPAVIKPVDSQGQRGVFKVAAKDDLMDRFGLSLAASGTGEVIIEPFIEGKEVSVNIHLYNSEIIYAFVSERLVVTDVPGGIPRGHTVPSGLSAEQEAAVVSLAGQVIRALDLTNGPVYFQMMVNETDALVLEAAPRLDGCHIWHLMEQAWGVNLLDIHYTHLLTPGSMIFPSPGKPIHPVILEFFHSKPGIPFCASDAPHDPGDIFNLYYNDGETVRPVNGILEKTGYKIARKALP